MDDEGITLAEREVLLVHVQLTSQLLDDLGEDRIVTTYQDRFIALE